MMAIECQNGFSGGRVGAHGGYHQHQVADWHIVAAYDDILALQELAKRCDNYV